MGTGANFFAVADYYLVVCMLMRTIVVLLLIFSKRMVALACSLDIWNNGVAIDTDYVGCFYVGLDHMPEPVLKGGRRRNELWKY